MKSLKNLIWGLLLLPVAAMAQDKPGGLMSIQEITVKPGHSAQLYVTLNDILQTFKHP